MSTALIFTVIEKIAFLNRPLIFSQFNHKNFFLLAIYLFTYFTYVFPIFKYFFQRCFQLYNRLKFRYSFRSYENCKKYNLFYMLANIAISYVAMLLPLWQLSRRNTSRKYVQIRNKRYYNTRLLKVFRTRKVWLLRDLFKASFRLVKPFSFEIYVSLYVSTKLEVLSAKIHSKGTTDVCWIV